MLGVQLLTCTTRTFGLTEIGHEFYERCTAVGAATEQAETSAMRLQAEPRGTLRVAVPVSFRTLHVAPVLHEFLSAYPDLRVEMTLTNRSVNLAEEGLDLCIIGRRHLQPGLARGRLRAYHAKDAPVALLAEFAPEDETIHAVYPPSRHLARKVRAFVDFLIERFAGTSRWDVAG